MVKWYSMIPFLEKFLNLETPTSIIDFCRAEGLNYGSFREAKRRYLKNKNQEPDKNVVPVILTKESSLSSNQSSVCTHLSHVSIRYTNGVSLELSSVDISIISQLINLPIR